MRILDSSDCCLSAQEIEERSRAIGRPVGISSAYWVVERLHALGLVRRLDLGDGVARYESSLPDAGDHHHLVCVDCGDVVPFEDPRIERLLQRSCRLKGFSVVSHEVVVRGRCSSCGIGYGGGG